MNRVGLIDRIKKKINRAVGVVQAIALLSICLCAGTTLPDTEYIPVGQAHSVSCVPVPNRPSFIGHQCLIWLIGQKVIDAWIHRIGVGLRRRIHFKTFHFDDIGLDFSGGSTDESRHQCQTPMVPLEYFGSIFIPLSMLQHIDSSIGSC